MDSEQTSVKLSEPLRLRCEQVLNELMAALNNVNAAVIATSDGFEIAARTREGLEVSKLAAMACSISALGAMAGIESDIGQYQDVIIEADKGSIVILEIPHPSLPMILNVVAGNKDILGQVLYQAKRAVATLMAAP